MAEGPTEPTPRQRQEAALRRAKEQARGGDPVAMVEALHESRALDGLASRLRRSCPGLSATDVDQSIAAAVDAVYAAVSRGDVVHDLMPWLLKVCYRHAWRTLEALTDRHSMKPVVERWDAALDRTVASPGGADDGQGDDPAERHREEAIAIARRLLPRLGQQNVQDVMRYLVDAVEAGEQDLPHRVVAEALGLNEGTVRVLMMRGLERLGRIARDEGLIRGDFELVKLGEEEPDEDDE